jgi:hypothetical protein
MRRERGRGHGHTTIYANNNNFYQQHSKEEACFELFVFDLILYKGNQSQMERHNLSSLVLTSYYIKVTNPEWGDIVFYLVF